MSPVSPQAWPQHEEANAKGEKFYEDPRVGSKYSPRWGSGSGENVAAAGVFIVPTAMKGWTSIGGVS